MNKDRFQKTNVMLELLNLVEKHKTITIQTPKDFLAYVFGRAYCFIGVTQRKICAQKITFMWIFMSSLKRAVNNSQK